MFRHPRLQSTVDTQQAFLARMNVSVGASTTSTVTTTYADFATGQLLDDYVSPSASDRLAALQTYLDVCEQYEDLILPGYSNFPLPGDIPEDLTLPFGEFVDKYNISATVPLLFEITALGVGDLMNTLTLYVMQAAGAPLARVFFGEASNVAAVSGNNHELYERIADFLGDDVLYNTTVFSSVRNLNQSDANVELTVQNSNGSVTQIYAKRLL